MGSAAAWDGMDGGVLGGSALRSGRRRRRRLLVRRYVRERRSTAPVLCTCTRTRALTRTRHRCARASPSTAAVRVGCRDLTSSCRSSPLESHAPIARTVQMALTAQHNSTTHKYSNSNRHYSSGTDKLKYVQLFTAKYYDTTTALGQTPTGMCSGP